MGSLIVWAYQSLFTLSHPTGGTIAGAIVLKVTDETEITLDGDEASLNDLVELEEGNSVTASYYLDNLKAVQIAVQSPPESY